MESQDAPDRTIKQGSQIKRNIDVVALVLTVIGVAFLSTFIQQTLHIPMTIMKKVLLIALIVVIASQIHFQYWIARWLKPLVSFLDSPPTKEEYDTKRDQFLLLLNGALRYPFRHISLSLGSWAFNGFAIGLIGLIAGLLRFGEMAVIINTVLFSSIVVNMIAYGSVKKIVGPVVKICAHFEGDDFTMPLDRLRSVRDRIMTFIGAIIIFLLLFFLQLLSIASLSSIRSVMQTQGQYYLSNLCDKLDQVVDPDISRSMISSAALPPGFTTYVIVDPQGGFLAGELNNDFSAFLHQVSTHGKPLSESLFAPLILARSTSRGETVAIFGELREIGIGFLQSYPFYLLFICITSFMALYIGRQIATDIALSLNDIGDSMRAISQGEGDLTRRIIGVSGLEIVTLTHWFNRFLVRLSTLILDSKTLSAELIASMKGIRSSSAEFMKESHEQEYMIREVAQATNIFLEYGKHVDENLRNSHTVSERSLTTAKQGITVIQEIVDRFGSLLKTSEMNTKAIHFLADESEAMRGIMELVENLADRTRLLSFNAMLEAVSAGDSGTRFTVVASEVQVLADNITHSTNEIKSIISKTLDTLQNLVNSHREERIEVEELAKKVQFAKDEFTRIFKDSETTAESLSKVIHDMEIQKTLVLESESKTEMMITRMRRFSDVGASLQSIITSIDRVVKQQSASIDRFKISP